MHLGERHLHKRRAAIARAVREPKDLPRGIVESACAHLDAIEIAVRVAPSAVEERRQRKDSAHLGDAARRVWKVMEWVVGGRGRPWKDTHLEDAARRVRSNQRQSEAISGNQRQSEALRSNEKQSRAELTLRTRYGACDSTRYSMWK